MDNNFSKLRKSTFGGFNKKDVIAYIEKVRNESYEYRTRVEKTVNELNAQVSELRKAADEALKEKEELLRQIGELTSGELSVTTKESTSETVSEINEATTHLKNVADELCQSLRDFMEKISENSVAVILEGSEDKEEEIFDGQKLMAEIEAEIYAKLGVAEEASETVSDTEYVYEAKKTDDKVSSILSAVASFSSDGATETENTVAAKEKDETVSNILGSLSFLK